MIVSRLRPDHAPLVHWSSRERGPHAGALTDSSRERRCRQMDEKPTRCSASPGWRLSVFAFIRLHSRPKPLTSSIPKIQERIRRVGLASKRTTTVTGNGERSYRGDGGPAIRTGGIARMGCRLGRAQERLGAAQGQAVARLTAPNCRRSHRTTVLKSRRVAVNPPQPNAWQPNPAGGIASVDASPLRHRTFHQSHIPSETQNESAPFLSASYQPHTGIPHL
jgi:hypothetical protein